MRCQEFAAFSLARVTVPVVSNRCWFGGVRVNVRQGLLAPAPAWICKDINFDFYCCISTMAISSGTGCHSLVVVLVNRQAALVRSLATMASPAQIENRGATESGFTPDEVRLAGNNPS